MVAKMMRWRPWPPLTSKKFSVKLLLRRLEGVGNGSIGPTVERLMVEVRWKGSKNALSSLRRTVKRNFTKEEEVRRNSDGGVGDVEWNEEFQTVCAISAHKDNVFHPWEILFTVLNVTNLGSKSKIPVIGRASLNIAEYACATGEEEIEINVPLTLPRGDTESRPILGLSFSLLELGTSPEPSDTVQRSVSPAPLSPRSGVPISPKSGVPVSPRSGVPVSPKSGVSVSPRSGVPVSPRSGESPLAEKDELSALKAGLRKVKIFKDYVSSRKLKKTSQEGEDSESRSSARSDEAYPFDSDSADDYDEKELDDNKDGSGVRKSFSYGTLAHANFAGESYYSGMRINGDYEDWVYYSNRKSDVGSSTVADTAASVSEQSRLTTSKRSILSWRKRKLSFRSPKAKGEPLLKKAYGEEGGDDIDFDRRQLNSSDESSSLTWRKVDEGSTTNRSSVSEFGDDSFAVGTWEHKEVVSRDGHMKLATQVFFASIDQRSERAAGESACTALVAVIADWFQTNEDIMPIKSQFDSLIREGSLEWRNLCENETYRARFPDRHFDLETVLQAKMRPLTVTQEKSFIGFFHPEGMEEGGFDFLQGAMSFDNIWDEISRAASECSSNAKPLIYIVSWNDHFFVLKVEPDAFYIIDTLGERLYEGCNQAYILKFDRDTTIHKVSNEAKSSEEKLSEAKSSEEKTTSSKRKEGKSSAEKYAYQQIEFPAEAKNKNTDTKEGIMEESENSGDEEEDIVCKGKESCKEYIKSFLAAIPIRELQVDIKKGLMESTPLHHRLQIEFHYTNLLPPVPEPLAAATASIVPVVTVVEVSC